MYHMSSHKCSTVWLYAVLLYATFTVMSMKRDIDTHASASSSSAPKSLRLDKLVQHRVTKAGLVAILQTLHDQGLLEKRYTIKQVRKEVTGHAKVQTPFGKVIQTFRIGGVDQVFEAINPGALLWYLCKISVPFAELIQETVVTAGDAGLTYVLYQDGVVPGNPFRPDKARKVEAWYWIFVQFPDFVLQRSACWPVATLIRSKLISKIPGGISRVSRILLDMFRPMIDGISLPVGGTHVVLKADFGGFLADLLAHKEIMCSKGVANAIHPCWNCANLAMRLNGNYKPEERTLACSDMDQFLSFSDDVMFEMIDRLHAAPAGKVKALETACGFNTAPEGILRDITLRGIYSPTNHHLRDWMHTLVGDGVANTETGLMLHALKAQSISLNMVQEFFDRCTLPRMHGKVNSEWLKESRLKDHTLSSFAATMLSIVPIVSLFLDFYNVKSLCPLEVESYELLHLMVSLLRLSPSKVITHITKLKRLWDARGLRQL